MGQAVMGVQVTIALCMALALSADVPGITTLRPLPAGAGTTPPSALPAPDVANPSSSASPEQTPPQQPVDRSGKTPLQPQSLLLLIRFVDGEFARVVQPLPGGKKGYKVPAGKPLDMKKLSDALRLYGTAASQGDTVQVTGIDFHSDAIVLRINGGGKKHFHLRDH